MNTKLLIFDVELVFNCRTGSEAKIIYRAVRGNVDCRFFNLHSTRYFLLRPYGPRDARTREAH